MFQASIAMGLKLAGVSEELSNQKLLSITFLRCHFLTFERPKFLLTVELISLISRDWCGYYGEQVSWMNLLQERVKSKLMRQILIYSLDISSKFKFNNILYNSLITMNHRTMHSFHINMSRESLYFVIASSYLE